MKKSLTVLLFCLLVTPGFSQNEYSRGFQAGYKAGYCHNDYGCIAPVPPITPIPLVGESDYNYQDGYNRGFKRGLEDKQKSKDRQGYHQQSGGSLAIPYNQSDGFFSKIAEYSQLVREREIAQTQLNEQLKREKVISLTNQVKSLYSSFPKYPEKISDGWHKVISTDNFDFCEERKVFVSNNQITNYIMDDWFERKISYPSNISKGKATVQLVQDDGSIVFADIYFLEFINNPNSFTSSPVGSGKISFWTNSPFRGSLYVYIDDILVGEITTYTPSGNPLCDQPGIFTFEYKPGTYSYKVIGNNRTWSGTCFIEKGNCSLKGLFR